MFYKLPFNPLKRRQLRHSKTIKTLSITYKVTKSVAVSVGGCLSLCILYASDIIYICA